MREQLIGSRAFGTKISLANRTLWIALDRNDLFAIVVNQLAAADAAVWANRTRDLRAVRARMHRARLLRHRLDTRPVFAFANLPNKRPFRKQSAHKSHLNPFASGVWLVVETVSRQRNRSASRHPRWQPAVSLGGGFARDIHYLGCAEVCAQLFVQCELDMTIFLVNLM